MISKLKFFKLLISALSVGGMLMMSVAVAAQATAIHDASLFTTNTLSSSDDTSTGAVSLGFTANINGTDHTTTYVNNNGNITFDNALTTFKPSALETGNYGPIIAPFFADVDTRGPNSGPVTYGTATLGGNNVFGVNYSHVGVYYEQPIYNKFQLILTDRSGTGPGNFDIQFNYGTIKWDAGTASAGAPAGGLCAGASGCTSALAGYWTSNSSNYLLPGSLVHGALVNGGPDALVSSSLNSNTLGQYNFQVRNGAVVTPTSAVPEPATLPLLGIGLVGLVGLGAMRRRKIL